MYVILVSVNRFTDQTCIHTAEGNAVFDTHPYFVIHQLTGQQDPCTVIRLFQIPGGQYDPVLHHPVDRSKFQCAGCTQRVTEMPLQTGDRNFVAQNGSDRRRFRCVAYFCAGGVALT